VPLRGAPLQLWVQLTPPFFPLQVRRTVWDLLSSDEDMAGMYLTAKRIDATKLRAVSDHEEVEILLEGFARQLEETANNIEVGGERVASSTFKIQSCCI
jgi:hypothetical protein